MNPTSWLHKNYKYYQLHMAKYRNYQVIHTEVFWAKLINCWIVVSICSFELSWGAKSVVNLHIRIHSNSIVLSTGSADMIVNSILNEKHTSQILTCWNSVLSYAMLGLYTGYQIELLLLKRCQVHPCRIPSNPCQPIALTTKKKGTIGQLPSWTNHTFCQHKQYTIVHWNLRRPIFALHLNAIFLPSIPLYSCRSKISTNWKL